MRLLLVEDDRMIGESLRAALKLEGHAVDWVTDAQAAATTTATERFDLVLLDLGLPRGNGLDVLRGIRARGDSTPVIVLTARDGLGDRVAGLDAGDDYLVKPFAIEELEARVRRLCRRVASGLPPVLRCGDLEVDSGRHEVRRAGVLLTLTVKEFDVLRELVARQSQPVGPTELIGEVWDPLVDPASNVLDVVITQLRRKLRNPPMIHTVRGYGYRIEPA